MEESLVANITKMTTNNSKTTDNQIESRNEIEIFKKDFDPHTLNFVCTFIKMIFEKMLEGTDMKDDIM